MSDERLRTQQQGGRSAYNTQAGPLARQQQPLAREPLPLVPSPVQATTVVPAEVPAKRGRRPFYRRPVLMSSLATGLLVLIGSGLWGWHVYQQRNAPPKNPFTAAVMASVQFQLYYPSWLPPGYHIDPKSVTEPSTGVVVFIANGSKGAAKLYFSEEARPSRYNIGGFYAKFTRLQEIGVNDGAIAVGHNGNSGTEIASRVNDKIWIIANTNNQLPYGQLIRLMENMKFSY